MLCHTRSEASADRHGERPLTKGGGVARRPWVRYSRCMAVPQSKTPLAGGCFLSLAIMAGVAIGVTQGEASLGFVIGLGVGLVIAVAVWLRDRKR